MATITTDTAAAAGLRYERKFAAVFMSRYEVESVIKLHPAMFSEAYPQRTVNNIYLDTPDLSSYFDNEDGATERIKTRVRWYGELLGYITEPWLELKTKAGLLGGKQRFPLPPFSLDRDFSLAVLRDVFSHSDLPNLVQERLKGLDFALLNRYGRKYFESADRRFRITIDFDLEYLRLDGSRNAFAERLRDREKVIVELKYAREDDDLAGAIGNQLPFRLTKSSKYATGIRLIRDIST